MPSASNIVQSARQVAAMARTVRRAGLGRTTELLHGRPHGGPDPAVDCVIEEFRCFGGRLLVSGRVRSAGTAVVGIGLRVPGRRHRWVQAPVAAGHGTWQCFSFSTPAPDGRTVVSDWHLQAALRDGTWVDLSDAPDRALGSEPFAHVLETFMDSLATRGSGLLVELGARARSGNVYTDRLPATWKYVGFDVRSGPNVDVVGDAHELSRYFAPSSVDAIMAISTFEHLAMPWKVVLEMNHVLTPGARVLLVTHQTWPLHDEPWDFWRFSAHSWRALFNESTGFRVDEPVMGQQADIVPRIMNAATATLTRGLGFLASAVIATKIGSTHLSWPVPTTMVVDQEYPA